VKSIPALLDAKAAIEWCNAAVRMRVVASALLILAGVASHGAQPAFDIRVTDAWIRWLPADLPGAGYVTLTNAGTVEQVLVGASSPDYAEISLHQTRRAQGMNDMVPIDSIKLAPNVSVNFAEAGYHFMLMQPRHPPRPGERVSIILRFSSGQSITAPFAVRGANASGQS
jgi:copper(I)-binding protein